MPVGHIGRRIRFHVHISGSSPVTEPPLCRWDWGPPQMHCFPKESRVLWDAFIVPCSIHLCDRVDFLNNNGGD